MPETSLMHDAMMQSIIISLIQLPWPRAFCASCVAMKATHSSAMLPSKARGSSANTASTRHVNKKTHTVAGLLCTCTGFTTPPTQRACRHLLGAPGPDPHAVAANMRHALHTLYKKGVEAVTAPLSKSQFDEKRVRAGRCRASAWSDNPKDIGRGRGRGGRC